MFCTKDQIFITINYDRKLEIFTEKMRVLLLVHLLLQVHCFRCANFLFFATKLWMGGNGSFENYVPNGDALMHIQLRRKETKNIPKTKHPHSPPTFTKNSLRIREPSCRRSLTIIFLRFHAIILRLEKKLHTWFCSSPKSWCTWQMSNFQKPSPSTTSQRHETHPLR